MVPPFPEKVMIQTTSRCNAACRFCPYPSVVDELPQGTMDEGLYRRIIDECAEHPGEVRRLLLYLMNEPLLDGELAERINYAKTRNPRACVHILTNGALLTERRGDALIDSGLDWIGLSIHGFSPSAYHEAMGLEREVTYRRAERFIRAALARRGPGFVMVTFNGGGPVTSDEREAALSYFRDLGVQRISYHGGSISRAGNVPVIPAPQHAVVRGCRSIWWREMLHVLYSGDVVLCCMDWRRRVVVGNLREQSIAELWRSEAYRRVRDTVDGRVELPDGFPCARCEEAIVLADSPEKPIDVAVIVLPCAVLSSDASVVPGVIAALRACGLAEQLVDISALVYRRMSSDDTRLWRRAGHGVVYKGDGSEELVRRRADEVEWCVARCRELAARHLLVFLCPVSRRLTLEVVRRIKERDPERSLLVFGGEEQAPALLEQLAVPYHPHVRREETAAWVARRLQGGERGAAPPSQPPPATPSPPPLAEPDWRPPGWEGIGAGMAPRLPEEHDRSPVSRWLVGLREAVRALPELPRRPLVAGRELRRRAEESAQAVLRWVLAARGRAAEPTTGVPGVARLAAVRREPSAGVGPRAVEDGLATEEGSPAAPAPCSPPADVSPAAHAPSRKPMAAILDEHLVADVAPPPIVPPPSPWQRRATRGRAVDLLLATLPPWGICNPPVGLAHLATYVRSKGFGVEVLDLNIDLYHRLGPPWQLLWHVENKNYWSNAETFDLLLDELAPHLDEYAELIATHPARLVGLSVVDPKERCTIELIRRVKARAPDKRILLGGPACVTPDYRRIFTTLVAELVDGYALGEGEELLCDVIQALRDGTDWALVPGVLCHRDGVDRPVGRRRRLLPLDRVPFPTYEEFELSRYHGDELIVEWSRGCVGACAFCKGKMIDGKHRSHSALAIVSALRRYAERLDVRKFTVCDPVINGEPSVLVELCRLIREQGLEVEWRGEAIPRPSLTPELLGAMRAAGCVELQLGVESGSDLVLERMHKRALFSAAEAAHVLRTCHEAGIRTALFIIVGFPGEGEAEFEQTCALIRDNAASIDEIKSINAVHVITDTPLHRRAEAFGIRLPDADYHCRWTGDGNTPEVRADRIRRLLALAAELHLPVRETNLAEEKHRDLAADPSAGSASRGERLARLQRQVATLESV
jgi:radical SAM superfamily enzyme YgiQ (UPF0313 family)/MoaA/NifB/PqqE/SkfB family radical SAM enzyme